MIKRILAVCVTAFTLAGPAAAVPVSFTLDAFVTSNFNASTLTQQPQYVDPINPAGTLTFSYDTIDAIFNGGSVYFPDFFNPGSTSFDLNLTLGGVAQTWNQFDFLIAQATVDLATASVLQNVDFILLTTGATAALADPNIVGITPVPGFLPSDYLRYDNNGSVNGINLELQTVNPATIPLPASMPLLAGAALLLVAFRRRSKA